MKILSEALIMLASIRNITFIFSLLLNNAINLLRPRHVRLLSKVHLQLTPTSCQRFLFAPHSPSLSF